MILLDITYEAPIVASKVPIEPFDVFKDLASSPVDSYCLVIHGTVETHSSAKLLTQSLNPKQIRLVEIQDIYTDLDEVGDDVIDEPAAVSLHMHAELMN